MRKKINYLGLFIVLLSVFSSCKENEPDLFGDVKGTYFSIKQYSLDEWASHAGDPLVFQKTFTVNGVKDSGIVNMEQLDWKSVVEKFLETDISDRKFLGRYKFSQFDDNTDNTHDFMYIATDKDMFTQQLLITMEIGSNKVTGIYIETVKNGFWKNTTQKLYYAPMKTIQIQQYDKPLIGKKKETVITYSSVKG